MSRRTKILLGAFLIVVTAVAALMVRTVRYGFSARDEPTGLESAIAALMRRYAAPSELREASNPVRLTPEILAEARAHFADHCAVCHGNDGKGQTEMGPRFYPKTPDLTLAATQSQSDGQLFATIENGVRMTGMPAWGDGTAQSARGSWALVHFIRHLPAITPAELREMDRLNPKSPAEREEEMKEDAFLQGSGQALDTTQPPHHH